MFECIAEDFSDRRKHMYGLKSIIAALSADQHRRGAEQAGWILSKRVKIPSGLWNGLVRLGGQASEESIAVQEVDAIEDDAPVDCVYYHVLAVLQHGEAVRVRGRKPSTSDVADVLEELVATEGALHRAVKEMYLESKGSAYHTVPIGQAGGLIECDDVFSHTLEFANVYVALNTAYYWMCLLALRTMHLDMRNAVGKKAYPYEYEFCGLGVSTITRNAFECADNLCMTLVTLASEGYVGMMCSAALLQLASRWYARRGDATKLGWCQIAGNALRSRGLMKFDIG
ncbi:hypothetical protein DOTSEDRAFT_25248 [Dothistroma septosporum NZE10]|uniref:Uncharacterized protein n=1 Tax=Dothistroma septosporum (strain NZE10 / CBS 128990) TaxID=675120 RepID=M2YMW8_DOTSN|nr:hypothetical protein DOTSEDRAFT_25248 [Dothistroma septosporum NZE10]